MILFPILMRMQMVEEDLQTSAAMEDSIQDRSLADLECSVDVSMTMSDRLY